MRHSLEINASSSAMISVYLGWKFMDFVPALLLHCKHHSGKVKFKENILVIAFVPEARSDRAYSEQKHGL